MGTFKNGLIDALHMACELERNCRNQPIKHALHKTQTWTLARMIDTATHVEHIIETMKQKSK